MEKEIIEVHSCGDCPFIFTEWDEYAINNDTTEYCVLALNTGQQEYFIDSYKRNNTEKSLYLSPDWCPLKNKCITIKLSK